MSAFNVVRFRVKPGHEQHFIDVHRGAMADASGMLRAHLVKTGDRSYCIIGEWESMAAMVAARPMMIANLDKFREDLEDLGNGLGVTDPVSGEVALTLKG